MPNSDESLDDRRDAGRRLVKRFEDLQLNPVEAGVLVAYLAGGAADVLSRGLDHVEKFRMPGLPAATTDAMRLFSVLPSRDAGDDTDDLVVVCDRCGNQIICREVVRLTDLIDAAQEHSDDAHGATRPKAGGEV